MVSDNAMKGWSLGSGVSLGKILEAPRRRGYYSVLGSVLLTSHADSDYCPFRDGRCRILWGRRFAIHKETEGWKGSVQSLRFRVEYMEEFEAVAKLAYRVPDHLPYRVPLREIVIISINLVTIATLYTWIAEFLQLFQLQLSLLLFLYYYYCFVLVGEQMPALLS